MCIGREALKLTLEKMLARCSVELGIFRKRRGIPVEPLELVHDFRFFAHGEIRDAL